MSIVKNRDIYLTYAMCESNVVSHVVKQHLIHIINVMTFFCNYQKISSSD